jgi:phytoene desaturase
MNTKKAIVIGAGIAGMAVSIRLRRLGYKVEVYEASNTFGGKVKEYRWGKFRFDTGPSLFTLPELLEEVFTLCKKNPNNYFSYSKLKLVTKYFYGNNLTVESYSNPPDFAKEVEQKLSVKSEVVLNFLKKQAKTYQLLAPIFLENPIHKLHKLFKIRNLSALFHVMNPRFLLTMNSVNKDFFKNEELTKLFNRYGTYNGSNPYKMPSLFNIISHLEHSVGAYLPNNGMREIPESLYKLATEEGVIFHFNSFVDKIEYKHDKITGVSIKGQIFESEVVVSNMDANLTYTRLIPDFPAPKYYLENEKSTSALIFHWAMDISSEELDVHNILFAQNYKEEFEYLFDKKQIYNDPTIYIYISGKQCPNDAPKGNENWFVMVNTPNLAANQDWIKEKTILRKQIFDKIKRILSIDVENHLLHENCITPIDLQDTTHSFLGSLYGGSSNSVVSAFLRHPNFSKLKGLYFAGGTVHPGGGVPLCLLSAKITSDLIKEDYNF